jgi:multidrug efflux system membrane fusion protein
MKSKYLILLLPLLFCCSKKTSPAEFTPKVEVAEVKIETIPISLSAVGHCTAYNSVEIKSQVEGLLEQIHYEEGHFVNEGDLLITIDPRPFEAALSKAIAIRAENIAKLKFAAEKVVRYQTLLPDDYISKLDFDNLVSQLNEYEAAVMQNDADIFLAGINLDFCYIKAPFSGLAGKKLIDKGNLIGNDSPTMVVINQINPIFIDFSLPERDFQTIMNYRTGVDPLKVAIKVDGLKTEKEAFLLLVDNTINKQNGMVSLRAKIDNEDNFFWPGQYVEPNLILKSEENAILIPTSSISTGQKGRFVYVVDEDNTAKYVAIKTFSSYGKYTHVEGDLKSSDKVITRGQINVVPGAKCEIVNLGGK